MSEQASTAPPQRTSGALWRYSVPAVTVIAGLLFGVSAAMAREDGGAGRPTDLVDLVRERAAYVEDLVVRTDQLSAEVDELSAAQAPLDDSLNDWRGQADLLAPAVGAAEVTGIAIQVTLDDAGYSLDTLPEGYTVDDVVVHEQDVHAVVNAMWAGGAEAMMVQDQRIISTSAVRCVGNTLYLQGRVYSPPYTITAIGDPNQIQAALAADPTVANYRAWADILGLGYEVNDVGETTFPAFSGSVRPVHARVPGGDDLGVASTELTTDDSLSPENLPTAPGRDPEDDD